MVVDDVYGAKTLEVEANFDQILALVRTLSEKLGIYLLNSMNPFRVEGQKSISIEIVQQLNWEVPDFVVIPGGNLGNVSALGNITALWAESTGGGAVAVSHNLETGRYEAFRLTITCGQ